MAAVTAALRRAVVAALRRAGLPRCAELGLLDLHQATAPGAQQPGRLRLTAWHPHLSLQSALWAMGATVTAWHFYKIDYIISMEQWTQGACSASTTPLLELHRCLNYTVARGRGLVVQHPKQCFQAGCFTRRGSRRLPRPQPCLPPPCRCARPLP